MLSSNKHLSLFNRSLWGTVLVFIIFSITFIFYVRSEKVIDQANDQRYESHMLAIILRQSSNDLTRMVRTYVLTGNPVYKQHYQEILDIRNGIKPRPLYYENIYWSLIPSSDKRSFTVTSPPISFLELMRSAGYTSQEFAKLTEAKSHSDELTKIELEAMRIVESTTPPTDENRHLAFTMLYDAKYDQAKYGIMKPISDAHKMIDNRTKNAILTAKKTADFMRAVFIFFGLVLIWTLWHIRRTLCLILGGSLQQLHSNIVKIGSGDLSSEIQIDKGMENSILGWLSETQKELSRIDAERTKAQKDAQRLRDLYAVLSQCNQAIVRCQNETELFDQICQDAVTFGGMKMAWIGLSDEESKELKAVAYAGEGTQYVRDLHIALDPSNPSSQGPTGTSFRENRPFWCQDFTHDPATQPWHEKGMQFGWEASAAVPLHRNGTPYGVLNIYAGEINAFDEAAQRLLLEMAADISFALDSFDREAQRKKSDSELLKLTQAIEQSPNSIIITDFKANIEYINAAFLRITGYTKSEVLGKNPRFLKSGTTPKAVYDDMWAHLTRHETWHGELSNCRKDGTQYIHSTNIAPVVDTNGNTTNYIAIEEDVTERKVSEERINYLANFDSLTGLPNRIKMDNHLQYTLNLAKRNEGKFALIFLDLDHFKNINDTLGHSIGDLLLMEVAKRLSTAVREEDTVSRMGGDEFVLLLPETDANGASQVAQKLLTSIANTFQLVNDHELSVTASLGIALYPSDGTDIETLSKNADVAMYQAKQEGRNAYCFFTHEMQENAKRHLELSNALHTALERNEFHLLYQPQLSALDTSVIGAEALIRWNHPQLGFVSPAEFIPIAENNGTILSIGEWVLRTAVSQAASWRQSGITLIMAVNLSAVQFRHPNLPDLVTNILEEAGLPPEYLELELTEGIAMHNPHTAIDIMNNLHDLGIRMSIDDFGTGYSSLAYLKKFKIYKLKIDQSFVRDISTDPEDKAIVSAVINMAKSLGLETIAEGVETIAQLEYLREQGCDEIQGYYYSKPILPEQFELFTQTHKKED